MQHPPTRNSTRNQTSNHGWLVALGTMSLSLVAGLACPGNLDPSLTQGAMGAAGNSGGGGGGGSSAGCADAPMIMAKTCADSIVCHKPNNSSAGGLDLSSDQAAHLLGIASSGDPAKGAVCPGGMTYLLPHTNPAQGYFIDKLNGPVCPDMNGQQMPYLTTWTDQQHQCVIDWANSITAP